MRLTQFAVRWFIAVVILCHITLAGRASLRADESVTSFKVGSIWRGHCVYEKSDYLRDPKSFVMVLYVKQRTATGFEAIAWYPTRQNGLLRVNGQFGKNGNITFNEVEVIHGRASATSNPEGVQAGNKFSGQLDKGAISGTGQWTGPAFNGEVRMTFSLRLAE